MGWLAIAAALLLGGDGGSPTPLVISIEPAVPAAAATVDAGIAPVSPPDDPRLLEELELLRQYELLEVYPLVAPD